MEIFWKSSQIVPAAETLCSLINYLTGLCYVLRINKEDEDGGLSWEFWSDGMSAEEVSGSFPSIDFFR